MPGKKTSSVYATAQSSLISSLLVLPGRVSDVIGLIDSEDFSDGRMKVIWDAIVGLNRSNKDLNYANLVEELNDSHKLEMAGNIQEIERLYNEASIESASMTDISTWAKIVKNAASNNRTAKLGDEISSKARKPGNARKLLEETRGKIDSELISLSTDQDQMAVSDYFDQYASTLEEKKKIYEATGGDILAAQGGIPSGFKTIDNNTGGFLPGQVTTVGARTGVGKSFFLVDCALHAAHAGQTVIFFSLEMSLPDLMNRFVSAEMTISLKKLQTGNLNDEEMQRVRAAREDFSKLNIEIDTTPEITLDYIRSKAQKMASGPKGLNLIILDYVQLVVSRNHTENREQQVAELSRGMKLLSMKLKVPVLQAVQLNRIQKGDEDTTPRIDDIRESNSIAQDSSVIILIHRDKTKGASSMDPAMFIIGKNRNGPDNIHFECNSLLKYSTFKEKNVDTEIGDEEDEPDDDSAGNEVNEVEDGKLDKSDEDELEEEDDPFLNDDE